MTTDIFIKSYRKDFEWLKYCLKSAYRHASGYRNIIIVVPPMDASEIAAMGLTKERVVLELESCDGYRFQQIVKLHADTYTNADYIWYVDSDCVFIKDCTPETFLRDGKPIVLMTPYAILNANEQNVPWQSGVEDLLGKPVTHEFMRRHPFFYPSWLLKEFRYFIETKFGRSFIDVIADKNIQLSEFNCLGAFAYKAHQDKFCFLDTEKDELPPVYLHQFWSYGGPDSVINKEQFKRHVLSTGL